MRRTLAAHGSHDSAQSFVASPLLRSILHPSKHAHKQEVRNAKGGKANRVAKGDFLMIPEGVPHQVTAVEGEATLVTFELPRPRAPYVP